MVVWGGYSAAGVTGEIDALGIDGEPLIEIREHRLDRRGRLAMRVHRKLVLFAAAD